jgi:predicted metal-dependent hydrolase
MDHSRRFWSLLEGQLPGFREPQRWLRANGSALVLPELS